MIIGITGGIASGKSTAAEYLRRLGHVVLDADLYARQAVEPGTEGYRQVCEAFPQVVTDGGKIDRAKLGKIVFSDPKQRRRLESIIHPIVLQRLKDEGARLEREGGLVFMEIPLLYEVGFEESVDEVWVVYVDGETQLDRLLKRSNVTRELAEQIIASQMPLAEKAARATRVIDNSGSLQATWAQLEKLLKEVQGETSPYCSR
ncbi:MAG: dephospho-CoA kinase [Firmicutes bacterium]|jgi:dephospho-CoA kinase|nr:dephospho-CoA kinase [Bacillota bacterium]NLO65519.1 dephospho-CoA kinase [Bacillota bacterium]